MPSPPRRRRRTPISTLQLPGAGSSRVTTRRRAGGRRASLRAWHRLAFQGPLSRRCGRVRHRGALDPDVADPVVQATRRLAADDHRDRRAAGDPLPGLGVLLWIMASSLYRRKRAAWMCFMVLETVQIVVGLLILTIYGFSDALQRTGDFDGFSFPWETVLTVPSRSSPSPSSSWPGASSTPSCSRATDGERWRCWWWTRSSPSVRSSC